MAFENTQYIHTYVHCVEVLWPGVMMEGDLGPGQVMLLGKPVPIYVGTIMGGLMIMVEYFTSNVK